MFARQGELSYRRLAAGSGPSQECDICHVLFCTQGRVGGRDA
ncbi:Uncharacterised protein [Bordetella pertussis]|nr:Uncharacterised protein [Bordetella pertussis]